MVQDEGEPPAAAGEAAVTDEETRTETDDHMVLTARSDEFQGKGVLDCGATETIGGIEAIQQVYDLRCTSTAPRASPSTATIASASGSATWLR